MRLPRLPRGPAASRLPRGLTTPRLCAVIALLTAAAVGGCNGLGPFGAARPTATPRPDQPCGGLDEQVASGFYPELEALLPAAVEGQAPIQKDSGRYCSAAKLGTLFTRDDHPEVHFAGAVWPGTNNTTGVSTVIFQAAGLTMDQVADSYAVAAGDASNVTRVVSSAETIHGRSGVRLEVINQDTTQLVIVWPGATPGRVDIVLGSAPDVKQLDAAVAALGSD